jgi:23S rRNA pseudouridine2605 synthase
MTRRRPAGDSTAGKRHRPAPARRHPPDTADTSATPAAPDVRGERLQKVLARIGVGSRRQIEQWIETGRIVVNGAPATLGQRITALDRIVFDGRIIERLETAPKARVIIYFKPEGEVCTRSDPEGRPTVFENLPRVRGARWIAVGRLDFSTSGLMIFTTDGELAHRLMHPSSEIEREYAVRILGEVRDDMLVRLKEGVMLDDGPAHFDSISEAGGSGANRWYHVILKEGRNREVRRMWEAVGATVSRLIRVRFGVVGLPRHLRAGRSEDLDPELLGELYRLVGLTAPETKTTRPRQPRTEKTWSRPRTRHRPRTR